MNHQSKTKQILTISPLALLTLTACGGGSGSTSSSSSSTQTVTGNIVKGPLSNALVFLDLNGNGTKDGNETSVRTDANGAFNLSAAAGANYTIVAVTDETTVDTSSGSVLNGVTLKAPSGASVVTPTTTLMEEGGLTAAQVAEVLNLPDDVDPLTFNPFAAGVDAADALAVEKVSQQIMTAVSSFASAAEGAGASQADAFTAALGSVIEVVKVKAENLTDDNASVADKTLDFSNATDLNLIKAEVSGKTTNLAGIDADAVAALIDDTATSIKNVNEEIAKVTDLDSDVTKAAFSTMQALIEEVKEAASAEAELAGSGNITYTDTSVVEAAAKNKAPTDIALSATSINELASSLVIGTASTTDSDQTDGVAFKYSIVAADGTDHAAFTINATTGELSLKEQPDYETKSSYKIIIKSTDEDGKSYQEEFEISVVDVDQAPIFENFPESSYVSEDGILQQSGTISASDPDGKAVTLSINSYGVSLEEADGVYTATASFGSLVLDSKNGSYTYTLNNDAEAVQSLSSTDDGADSVNFRNTFEIIASDGSKSVSENLVFNVKGANDTPGETVLSLIPDVTQYLVDTQIGTLDTVDPDGNGIFYELGTDGDNTLFRLDATNLISVNNLPDGSYTIDVTADDLFGGTSTTEISFTISSSTTTENTDTSDTTSTENTPTEISLTLLDVSDYSEGTILGYLESFTTDADNVIYKMLLNPGETFPIEIDGNKLKVSSGFTENTTYGFTVDASNQSSTIQTTLFFTAPYIETNNQTAEDNIVSDTTDTTDTSSTDTSTTDTTDTTDTSSTDTTTTDTTDTSGTDTTTTDTTDTTDDSNSGSGVGDTTSYSYLPLYDETGSGLYPLGLLDADDYLGDALSDGIGRVGVGIYGKAYGELTQLQAEPGKSSDTDVFQLVDIQSGTTLTPDNYAVTVRNVYDGSNGDVASLKIIEGSGDFVGNQLFHLDFAADTVNFEATAGKNYFVEITGDILGDAQYEVSLEII